MRLIEVQPFTYKVLEAKEKTPGTLMKLEGVFQRADIKNANGRVYPLTLWNKVISDEDVVDRLKSRRMVGELDHPASGATSIDRISHVVTGQNLNPDGTVTGVMEILDTPAGRIAETLFKAGVQLGVSSRGDGSVEKKGDVDEVQEDFKLETYDIVLKPSTPGAYPKVTESESKNSEVIASAVEGLVKSTNDIDVLLECYSIISVLEGCDERCKLVNDELKRKLSSIDTHVEETMSDKSNPPGLSTESVVALKEHLDRGIAEAVREKDAKISALNERIVDLSKKNEEFTSRVASSIKRMKAAESKVSGLEGRVEDTSTLKSRYEAAVKLLDEAIPRLRTLKETTRRLEAAKKLIGASITKHRTEAVNTEITKAVRKIKETSLREKYQVVLSGCRTVTEVRRKVKELSSLVETARSSREPLPKPIGRKLTESKKKDEIPQDVTSYVLRSLVKKVS